MVLCASDDAHGSVEPVAVPADVPLGERIEFEGYTGVHRVLRLYKILHAPCRGSCDMIQYE